MKGHIRKRGNKYAVVIDIGQKEDGSRNRKWFSGFDKQKEAQKFLNEKLHEIETGKFIEPAKETFGEYLSGWLEDKKSQVRPSTWKSYRWLVNRVIKHLLMFFPGLQEAAAKQFADSLFRGQNHAEKSL